MKNQLKMLKFEIKEQLLHKIVDFNKQQSSYRTYLQMI
jgi:hypothetical protein